MDPTTVLIMQVLTQVHTGAVIVYLLQKIKTSKYFPWINAQSSRLNRWVAIIASAAAALGIHASFNHQAGVLTITGLTVASIAQFAGKWLQGFIYQELIYQATIKQNGTSVAFTQGGYSGTVNPTTTGTSAGMTQGPSQLAKAAVTSASSPQRQ